jgi:acyl carrier protein
VSVIHPKITEVLAQTFKVPAVEISPHATMDSLEMDSLAVAEFAVIIKERLGVDTDADTLLKGATLAEISAFLDEAQDHKAGEVHQAGETHKTGEAHKAGESYGAVVGVGR